MARSAFDSKSSSTAMNWSLLRWGAWPGSVEVFDLVVGDGERGPLIAAKHAACSMSLTSLIPGGGVTLHSMAFRDYGLSLRWSVAGDFNWRVLLEALQARGWWDSGPSRGRVSVEEMTFQDGSITVSSSDDVLTIDDVSFQGQFARDPQQGFELQITLQGRHAQAHWRNHTRELRADVVRVTNFHWQGSGFQVDRLELRAGVDNQVSLAGSMDFRSGLSLWLSGDVALTPVVSRGVFGDSLPDGGRMQLANSRWDRRGFDLDLIRAETPTLTFAGIHMESVDMAGRLSARRTLLGGRLNCLIETSRIGRLSDASQLEIVDLELDSIRADLKPTGRVTANAVKASNVVWGSHSLGSVNASMTGRVTLKKGALDVKVEASAGDATAHIELKPVPDKAEVSVDAHWQLSALVDGALGLLREHVPPALLSESVEPVDAVARYAGLIQFEDMTLEGAGGYPLSLRGAMTEAHLSGGLNADYESGRWVIGQSSTGGVP